AYYNAVYEEFTDEETLTEKGVKLISYEYPTPIENSFSFSHISYFSGAIVIPGVLIALLALLAIAIFEKKDNLSRFTVVNTVSVVLNFVICLTLLPFLTVAGALADINGGGPELDRQILYFIPIFTALCVAASVALRRKGNAAKSIVVQLLGPAVFTVYLIVCAALGLL
ncbi:MAG: hypothetical protein IKZ23_02935, partial [Clostridia bacterium]|nr:hypothetical protein [Clostridia bacterium]